MSIVSLEKDSRGDPRFSGCSNIRDFEFIGKLGEGTFGYVSGRVYFKRHQDVDL
jgi:serine/threonine-protein kinase BUR1